jgi:hypothetical protein
MPSNIRRRTKKAGIKTGGGGGRSRIRQTRKKSRKNTLSVENKYYMTLEHEYYKNYISNIKKIFFNIKTKLNKINNNIINELLNYIWHFNLLFVYLQVFLNTLIYKKNNNKELDELDEKILKKYNISEVYELNNIIAVSFDDNNVNNIFKKNYKNINYETRDNVNINFSILSIINLLKLCNIIDKNIYINENNSNLILVKLLKYYFEYLKLFIEVIFYGNFYNDILKYMNLIYFEKNEKNEDIYYQAVYLEDIYQPIIFLKDLFFQNITEKKIKKYYKCTDMYKLEKEIVNKIKNRTSKIQSLNSKDKQKIYDLIDKIIAEPGVLLPTIILKHSKRNIGYCKNIIIEPFKIEELETLKFTSSGKETLKGKAAFENRKQNQKLYRNPIDQGNNNHLTNTPKNRSSSIVSGEYGFGSNSEINRNGAGIETETDTGINTAKSETKKKRRVQFAPNSINVIELRKARTKKILDTARQFAEINNTEA